MPTDYEKVNNSGLRKYLGQRCLGVKPVDVEQHLGKRESIYKLARPELLKLIKLVTKEKP